MLRLRERGSDPGALLSRGVGAVYGGHDLGRGTPGRSAGKTAGEKLEREILADEKGKKGKVWIAGAGPGDAGLLTVRTAHLMRQADVSSMMP